MKTILIVDDLDINRKLLYRLLTIIGEYIIVEASNGFEALEVFENKNIDLILMDIKMPHMDGYQSAAAIKEKTKEHYVPIIFVTALADNSSLSHALSSGGDDFISKPVEKEVLESKILAHLRIRELNQKLNEKNKQLQNHYKSLQNEQKLVEYFFDNALKKSFIDGRLLKYYMTPISTFNGDLLLIKDKPNGGVSLMVGDFTGHGLTAAMGTLPVAMIFFKMIEQGHGVADIAQEINDQLYKLMPTNIFFAATLIELSSSGENITVWAGGMPECYWINKEGDLKGEISSKHLALGILADSQFDKTTEKFIVDNEDKFYLYSDGIIESTNQDNEMYGNKRLKQALLTHKKNRFDEVINDLDNFSGDNKQNDDITFVEFNCINLADK